MTENTGTGDFEDYGILIESPPARFLRLLSGIVVGTNAESLSAQQVGKVLAQAMQEFPDSRQGSWSLAHTSLLVMLSDARDYVKDRIEGYEGSPHEETFNELNDILSALPLHDTWNNYRKQLTTLVRSSLRFSVHLVDTGRPRLSVAVGDIEAVRQDVEGLIERVKASSWLPPFKAEMLDALANLLDRLTRFQIFGEEGVSKATSSVVGTVAMNVPRTQSDLELVKDTLDVAVKIADVILKYSAVTYFGVEAIKRLTS